MRPPIRVVIVDDDGNDSRTLFAKLLRDEGCEIAQFDSGTEALTYAEGCTVPTVLFLGGLRHFLGLQARIEAGISRNVRLVLATGAPSYSIPRLPQVLVLKKPMDAEEMFAAIVGAIAWLPPAPLCAA